MLGLFCFAIYNYEKGDDIRCKRICERKGYENVEEFGVPLDCKCIDKFGDIKYERKS